MIFPQNHIVFISYLYILDKIFDSFGPESGLLYLIRRIIFHKALSWYKIKGSSGIYVF